MGQAVRSRLPWKHCWITGGSSGIGRALALAMASQGVSVSISGRHPGALAKVQAEAADLPGRICNLPLDITDSAAVQALVDGWQPEAFPDLIILNAGTHQPDSAQNFSLHQARRLVDINLQGTLNCLAAVLPGMTARGSGQLAVMASVAGYRGLPGAAVYGATKAALINLTESLQPELAEQGIRLQLINPGFVKTPLTDRNRFPMPWLVPAEAAAEAILKGLRSRRFEISFPGRFVFWLKLARLLPYRLYFSVVARITRA
ncbi:SDR family NAD(P)-dependent oxidoreductase [Marinobacterium jannaschii]|uniref:SDR family NAD(P)-dependent oxidoreductase n=1 Tax=Marinobacterium jannaschii TaxID=64970 RepID=UPI000685A2FA|nr:SDR family NAD(P)-dependent oxidoreductase [Marinobacterium jannaschii]